MEGGVDGRDPLAPSLGNSWRTTTDIQENWASMMSNINHVRRYYISYISLSFCFALIEQGSWGICRARRLE
jgi:hypothetical protein